MTAPTRAIPWRRFAIAAAVLLAVAIPFARRDPGTRLRDPSGFVMALSAPNAGLSANWDGAPWSAMRGGSSGSADEARAIRLGARLVDLELAVRAKSTDATVVARDGAALLDGFAAAGPVVARLASVSPTTARDTVAAITRDAALIAGAAHVARGALIETARIAAAAGDRAFFDSPAWIEGMPTLPSDTPERAKLVGTIKATSAHGADPMGAYLALTDLLRSLAG